mgnify:CR=1 FL=1
MTPDAKAKAKAKEKAASTEGGGLSPDQANKSDLLDDEEDFFDFISRSAITSSTSSQVPAALKT